VAVVLNEQGSPKKKEGEAARFAGIGGPAGLFIAKGEGDEHKGILGIEFGGRTGRIDDGSEFPRAAGGVSPREASRRRGVG